MHALFHDSTFYCHPCLQGAVVTELVGIGVPPLPTAVFVPV